MLIKHSKFSGFTLIELMITVAIISITTMLAAPSFQDMLTTNRLASLSNEFIGALNLARSEAVKRGRRVTVCRTDTPDSDTAVCSTDDAKTWLEGWMVFVDNSTAGTFDSGAGDERLKIGKLFSNNITVTAPNTFSSYISFAAIGGSNGNGTFDFCLNGKQRSIVIITTGRVRLEKGDC